MELNKGITGKYSTLKVFHHPEKVKSLLERRVTSPLYVRVKPTNNCNHNCVYCLYHPEYSGIHQTVNRMDEIPKEKMMEVLDDFKEMGVKAVTFSGGGEPLLHPNITEILKKTLENRIRLSMITNGQSLKGEPAKLLYNADWVRVSLDYCTPEMFTEIRRRPEEHFDIVRQNIQQFARNKSPDCDLGVNCVVSNYNFDRLFDIAKFCKDLGVDNLRFSPFQRFSQTEFLEYHTPIRDKVKKQIEKAKELQDAKFSIGSSYEGYFRDTNKRGYPRCFYMEIVPVVASDQNIYTCHNRAYEPDGKIGSIKTQSFKDVWFSKKTAEFFKNFNPQKLCNHECSNDEKNRILNEFSNCKDKGVMEYV